MPDIFISYDRDDIDHVQQIAHGLNAENVSYWWDKDLQGGDNFGLTIEDKIAEVNRVLVAWSSNARTSVYVRGEALEALDQGKLVQVMLDNSRLPVPFNAIQATFLHDWQGDRLDQRWRGLVTDLTGLEADPASPDAPTPDAPDVPLTPPVSSSVPLLKKKLSNRQINSAGVNGVQRTAFWLLPLLLLGLLGAGSGFAAMDALELIPTSWPPLSDIFLGIGSGVILIIAVFIFLLTRTLLATLEPPRAMET